MDPAIPPTFNLANLINTLNQINLAIAALNKTISTVFPTATGTAATATGGAATLPGNPVGFIQVFVPSLGSTVKVPYYAA